MDPFLREDAEDRGEMITDAAVRLLDQHGTPGLTVSAIARDLGVSPQALTFHFSGARGARRRVIQLATVSFCRRWEGWAELALLAPVPCPALPVAPEELRGVRVWLALQELARAERGRGNDDPGAAIAVARSFERDVLRAAVERCTGSRVPDAVLTRIQALTDGLRAELVSPSPAVDAAAAFEVLRGELARLRDHATQPPTAAELPYM